jgi:hypothetical protein
MTKETQEQLIDPLYGFSIGSRRWEISRLYYKLKHRHHISCMAIHKKYERDFKKINRKCKGLTPWRTLRCLAKEGYFDLLDLVEGELKVLRESSLGIVTDNDLHNIFDTTDHKNMLNASDGLWRIDSDPVIANVLTDSIYDNRSKNSLKKQKDRQGIYNGRRMKKEVYEGYLSEAVGKPITIEQYEREFGFLS